MKIFLTILGVIVISIISFSIYRSFAVDVEAQEFDQLQMVPFESLSEKLQKNAIPSQAELLKLASKPSTRQNLFYLLREYEKESLFPQQYYHISDAAESNLVNWLEFPTELDGTPQEIELVKIVEIKEKETSYFYYVFKFKTVVPHWAAENGWMLGVVGPYFENTKPYDYAEATFSRLSKLGEMTPDEEAKWVHQNITF